MQLMGRVTGALIAAGTARWLFVDVEELVQLDQYDSRYHRATAGAGPDTCSDCGVELDLDLNFHACIRAGEPQDD